MAKENDNVIRVNSKAFYMLIDTVIEYLDKKYYGNDTNVWISGEEAMKLLNIKSKTTLQALRNTGKLRFSQPAHRILLYDKRSIFEYIEAHAKEPF